MTVPRVPREEIGNDVSLAEYPVLRLPPEELDNHIETHGIGARLRSALACPCVRPDTKMPRSGCPVCRGIGFNYPEELERPVIVFVLSRSARQRALAAGRHYDGTAEVTFPSGIIPARGDMLLPDDEVHVVTEVLHRATLEVDARKLRTQLTDPDARVPVVPVPVERLLYPDVTLVEVVAWLDGDEQVIGIEGEDYAVDGSRITFVAGRGPVAGRGYTVRYRAPAAYVLADPSPVYRSEGDGHKMPHKATVSRLDRWGEPDARQ